MAQIKIFLIVAFMLCGFSFRAISLESEPVFRFTLPSSPSTFDPAQFYGTETTHFFQQLYRGLYRYDNDRGLIPEGAKECLWKNPLELVCRLNPHFKWSDGTSVTSHDYVRAFRHLVEPNSRAREVGHLLALKNAKKIIAGSSPVERLGVLANSDLELQFIFEKKDLEFISRLTSSALVPWKIKPDVDNPEKLIVNGPYRVEKFVKDQRALLTRNPFNPLGNPERPQVEILFTEEDSTSQNLFDFGRINFLMRLNVAFIPKYKEHKGIFNVPLARFDYIGYGGDLANNKDLRKALSLSLNYKELGQILYAAGDPGCHGLTRNFVTKPLCYKFDLAAAKKSLNRVPKNLLEKPIVFKFSRAGGDNILRAMEWFQNQWKKNLGLRVDLEPVEQGMYLQEIKRRSPDIFRKGINLDRPTCLSALESFGKNSPDNYIRLSSEKYETVLSRLAKTADEVERKKLCLQGIKILMDDYWIIPQGLIHYTMLEDGKFKGFNINELFQLDLSNLAFSGKK